jgi:hypothetical protein
MDGKTCLLGVIPPLLAYLAEAKNPVSANAIRPKAIEHAQQHVFQAINVKRGHQYDEEDAKNALVTTIVAVGETAGEVSGIIPTWISLNAAAAAIFLDTDEPAWVVLLILLLITCGSAVLAIQFFQGIDYQREAVVRSGIRSWPCGRERQVESISCWIKLGNLAIAATVVIVWLATSSVLPDAWHYLQRLCG